MKKLLVLLPLALAACESAPSSTSGACDPDAPNTICTIAGNGNLGFSGDEGAASKAALYYPQDTAVGPDGQVWISDFNNYLFRSIDEKGLIHTRVGIGILGDSPRSQGTPTCDALDAKLNHSPTMFFHDGFMYFAAWHNSDVKRVELDTMQISDYAGTSKRTLFSGDEGPAIEARIDLPSGVTAAPNGDIVFMDQGNQVIQSVDSSGTLHHLAGDCLIEHYDTTPDICAGHGTLGTTLNACPNSEKSTYCTNVTEACAWACTGGYAGDGGPALQLRMDQPVGQSADPGGRLAYDTAGNLFFADTDGNRIRKIDTSGIVSTVAGIGGADGYSGDGGPATQAQIAHPVDLAIDTDGTLYFTDVHNNCVRKIDPTGTISAVAGDCSSAGQCGSECVFTDVGSTCSGMSTACFTGDGGPPLAAKMNRPYGIDLEGKKLYISDTYNSRIRVVNLP